LKRLVILGSRDLAQQMALHFSRSPDVRIVGFLDDFRPVGEETSQGPILGGASEALAMFQAAAFDLAAVGIGYRHMAYRGTLLAALKKAVPLATYVHPTCWVDPTASIEEGCFLLPGCIVDSNVRIGAGSLLNAGCLIAHDSIVGENCFLGPRVTVAGFTRIEAGCFLGVGTTVIDNVRVGPAVQTGGGAVVVEDSTGPGLYLGLPARRR
jgi:sugar O-acyltransferase (sialic acid O-acetyltransferase NeuD family)